jgi:hypothetical protein
MWRHASSILKTRCCRALLVFFGSAALLWYFLPSVPNRVLLFERQIVSVSPDSRLFACDSKDGVVELYHVDHLTRWASFPHENASYVLARRFSPDGRFLLVRLFKNEQGAVKPPILRLWDCTTKRHHADIPCHGNAGVHGFCFSPDSQRLVVADGSVAKPPEHTMSIWDIATANRVLTLRGHKHPIHTIGWSADGRQIVSGASWGEAKLWDVATGREVMPLDSGSNLAFTLTTFSADCQLVFGFQQIDNQLTGWESASGRRVFSVKLPGEAVAYFGERRGKHVFCQWRKSAWVKWLLDRYEDSMYRWTRKWLHEVELFNEFIDVDGETGQWSPLLTLPPKTGRLDFLHVGEQVLAYRRSEPRQIEWWDLSGGARPWQRIVGWAAVSAAVYWGLSTLRAWRRKWKGTGVVPSLPV